ncbi:MAG: MmcQ/YjbR family DNA-binding protein [Janthinobacterium lividum]
MDAERARAFLLTLPHVVETMQWGNNLVFWIGDKAIGGKMFTLLSLDGRFGSAVAFAAGAERAAELVEQEGIFPAPYLARAGWVAAKRWDVLRSREWQGHFTHAHGVVFAKLPARTRTSLALPPKALKQLIAARRQLLTQQIATRPVKQKSH